MSDMSQSSLPSARALNAEALFLTLSFSDVEGSPGYPGNIILFLKEGVLAAHEDKLIEKLGNIPNLMLLGVVQLLRTAPTPFGEIHVHFTPGMLDHSLSLPQDTRFTEKMALREVAQAADAILSQEGWAIDRMPSLAHWGDTLRDRMGAELVDLVAQQAREWERGVLADEAAATGAVAIANHPAPRV